MRKVGEMCFIEVEGGEWFLEKGVIGSVKYVGS